MSDETAAQRYDRYRTLLTHERLPAACIDLDAVDTNLERFVAPAKSSGKRLRVATKSLRCHALTTRVLAALGDVGTGVMTFAARETLELAKRGIRDLLLAYPTMRAVDADDIASANQLGARAAIVVDCAAQLEVLDAAGTRAGVRIPVVLDFDLSYRPLGDAVHIGVLRSPIRTAHAALALAAAVDRHAHLQLAGAMSYEAHLAGIPDRSPGGGSALDGARRFLKSRARTVLHAARREVSDAFARAGRPLALFNGGGTGSIDSTCEDPSITEVTVGSGFLDSHLFDRYDGLRLAPAVFFALQAVRAPDAQHVTCHGGGYIASGEAAPDRLPIPWLPEGLSLRALEGAGEVQTPVKMAKGASVALGDPVLFRHAKAGELAEHFNEYLLVRADRVEAREKTYRGEGFCFLG